MRRFRAEVVKGRHPSELLAIQAGSLDDARQQMVSQGYHVLSLRPVGFDGLGFAWRSPARIASFDVTVFAEQLRDLLTAGLSVIEAVSTLRQADSAPILNVIDSRLRAGQRLSDALAGPSTPSLLVALIRASELTSDLPQALNRYLEHEQRVRELKHRISSVAIYPALLAAVGTGVLLFLLFYVMPRFARVFDGMGGALPWSARAMVAWAHALASHSRWLYPVLASMALAVAGAAASAKWRAWALRRLLEWAPLRQRLRTYFLARWYRATGMLVQGGIPLAEALKLSCTVLPAALQGKGAAVEQAVREGRSPAAAHELAGMATPVARQLMQAGERIGELGAVLVRVAQFHEAELTRSLERGMRALEPVVMVFVGVGIGAVVVLMYLPIFELAAAIQ